MWYGAGEKTKEMSKMKETEQNVKNHHFFYFDYF